MMVVILIITKSHYPDHHNNYIKVTGVWCGDDDDNTYNVDYDLYDNCGNERKWIRLMMMMMMMMMMIVISIYFYNNSIKKSMNIIEYISRRFCTYSTLSYCTNGNIFELLNILLDFHFCDKFSVTIS